MAAKPTMTLDRAVIEQSRRTYRDAPPAAAPVDKTRVLAHLRAQLAELEARTEVAHVDA